LRANCDATTIFVGKALCIHEKFEYSYDITNKAHPHPSWLVYFVLNAQPFFINFGAMKLSEVTLKLKVRLAQGVLDLQVFDEVA
jgi:hypothetical protein